MVLGRALLGLHHRRVRLPRASRVAAALARQIGAADSVLDVGAYDGRVAREVGAQLGARRVVGVDVRAPSGAEIEVLAYDGARLPFDDESFDAVLLSDVLHHADDPASLLREALRVARRAVAVKDHLRTGVLSSAVLLAMDVVGNFEPGIVVRGKYLSAPEWIALVAGAGGRLATFEWPLRIHDLPWRLVATDRLHFAARIEPVR